MFQRTFPENKSTIIKPESCALVARSVDKTRVAVPLLLRVKLSTGLSCFGPFYEFFSLRTYASPTLSCPSSWPELGNAEESVCPEEVQEAAAQMDLDSHACAEPPGRNAVSESAPRCVQQVRQATPLAKGCLRQLRKEDHHDAECPQVLGQALDCSPLLFQQAVARRCQTWPFKGICNCAYAREKWTLAGKGRSE